MTACKKTKVEHELFPDCETRGERVEALAEVSSSLKKEQEVQKDLPTPPVETIQRRVDTRELKQELSKMIVATQTGGELAGREERGKSIVEAGMGDIKGEVDVIPGGWEMIWVEDP